MQHCCYQHKFYIEVYQIAEKCNMGISEENDEGIVADQAKQTRAATEAQMDQRALEKLETTMQLEHSFKLFRPLTALMYFSRDCCLISGSFGMVL